ncbi:MAG: twin-arginine translocase subunit TatC [Granulosicoccus sp.]|nr:twin-arginine translocase subunit TatC [Granulosicoccus sp.]
MNEADEAVSEEQTFMSHLIELRDRLMRMVLCIVVLFLCLFWFSNDIFTWLAQPLISNLPEGSSMQAIDPAAPFLVPFKLVLMLCIFIGMPYLLYHIWGFVAPGLYTHEKRLAFPLLVSSIFLFYLGVAFAYYVVFPLAFKFFTMVTPVDVLVNTDIGRYLSFVITIFFAFGIAFEVPVATVLVVATGVTTPEDLAAKRPYFIIAAFVVGMFLTPPDVISQTLLALPMWLLFEMGIYFSKHFVKRQEEFGEAREKMLDEEYEKGKASAEVKPSSSGTYSNSLTDSRNDDSTDDGP